MKKALAWTAGLLVGLVVLVAAAGAILIQTVDQQALLNELAGSVKDKTGRELKFNGPVDLKWFPSIGARLSGVTLSEAAGAKEAFVELGSVDVSLGLLALIDSRIVIDGVTADNVKVRVVRDAQGRFNFDDLTAAGQSDPGTAEETGSDSGTLDFSVNSANLTNLNLTYLDQGTGQAFELKGWNVESGKVKPGVPFDLKLNGQVLGAQPKADLSLALESQVTFGLGEKTFADLKSLALTVDGMLDGQKADITVQADGVRFDSQTLALVVERLKAVGEAAVPGAGQLKLDLSAPRLDIQQQSAKGEAVSVTALLTQADASTVQATVNLNDLSGGLDKIIQATLSADIRVKQASREVLVKLGSPLQVDAKGQTVKLAKLNGTVKVDDSSLPKSPVNLGMDGSLALNAKTQQLDTQLKLQIEQEELDLKAGLTGFSKPNVKATLSAAKLDLDALLPASKDQKASGPEGSSPDINKIPVDLSALKLFDAEAVIKIGQLKASGLLVNALNAQAVVKAGRLTINPLSAALYEGNTTGQVLADSGSGLVQIKQELKGVQIEPLMKDLLQKDMAAGKGDVSLDLTARGATIGDMRKSLNGRVAVALTDGAVKGFNLAESLRNAKSLLTGQAVDQTAKADSSRQTDFSSFNVSFDVKNGVATSNDLRLMAPLFRIGGQGQINLVDNSLDYTADASIVATSTGQGGKTLDSGLKGLTVPVKLFGEFSAIQWKLLLADLAKAALKAKIDEKLEAEKAVVQEKLDTKKEELKQKAEDKVKDALKGFLNKQ